MAYFRFFAHLRAAPAATLMLSMRLGYARPALLARPFAAVFCKEESLRDIFPLLYVDSAVSKVWFLDLPWSANVAGLMRLHGLGLISAQT